MKLEKFIVKSDITQHMGIKVTKNTNFTYQNKNVKQSVKNLKFKTFLIEKNEQYTCKSETILDLKDGDVLIFDEIRGYILPGIAVYKVEEAIEELGYIMED